MEKWIHNIHIPNATWLKCAFRWLKLMVYEKIFFNGNTVCFNGFSIEKWHYKGQFHALFSINVTHQKSLWFQIKQRGWKSIDNELVKESLSSKSILFYYLNFSIDFFFFFIFRLINRKRKWMKKKGRKLVELSFYTLLFLIDVTGCWL